MKKVLSLAIAFGLLLAPVKASNLEALLHAAIAKEAATNPEIALAAETAEEKRALAAYVVGGTLIAAAAGYTGYAYYNDMWPFAGAKKAKKSVKKSTKTTEETKEEKKVIKAVEHGAEGHNNEAPARNTRSQAKARLEAAGKKAATAAAPEAEKAAAKKSKATKATKEVVIKEEAPVATKTAVVKPTPVSARQARELRKLN